MARSETWTITPVDRAGHRGTPSSLSLTFAGGFQFGVTVGANDSRLPASIAGGSAEALAWAAGKARAALGRDLGSGVKIFGSSGVETAEKKWHDAGIFEPRPLLTNEVWNPPALDRVMSRLTQPVDYCWRQEFMDKVTTAAQFDTYLGQYADLRAQIDDHPNGHLVWLRFVGNEAVERQQPAGSPIWRKVIDRMPERVGIGNDTYVTQTGMLDPAKGMKGSLDWLAAASQTVAGVTLDISESGFSAVNFTPRQRADAMQAYHDKLAPIARSYSYWATCNLDKGPANDWSFDQPGQEIVAAKAASLIGA